MMPKSLEGVRIVNEIDPELLRMLRQKDTLMKCFIIARRTLKWYANKNGRHAKKALKEIQEAISKLDDDSHKQLAHGVARIVEDTDYTDRLRKLQNASIKNIRKRLSK